jgi:uncharacterized protein YkwD
MKLKKTTEAFCILFAFCLFFSSCKSGNNSLWVSEKSDVQTELNSFESEFMTLINQHRQSLSLNPLIFDSRLRDLVLKHSEEMAAGDIPFGHLGFLERCSEGKVIIGGGNLCAENVAMGQKTPQAVFSAWMGSTGHRGNIEQTRFTHTGVSYKQGINGSIYWTQIFIEKN